jgi:predicted negative regulator of RcsB-dependent stress response
MTSVSLVYGALLGFTIVVGWEQFSSAEANVSHEASTLTTMYRQTVGMPVQEQTRMRQLLRNYTTAVAGPNGKKQYARVVEPKTHEMRSTRCTGCSAVSNPASRPTR